MEAWLHRHRFWHPSCLLREVQFGVRINLLIPPQLRDCHEGFESQPFHWFITTFPGCQSPLQNIPSYGPFMEVFWSQRSFSHRGASSSSWKINDQRLYVALNGIWLSIITCPPLPSMNHIACSRKVISLGSGCPSGGGIGGRCGVAPSV